MKTRVIKVRSDKDSPAAAAEAADALKQGLLVGFPTETVYGVAAAATSAAAMERLRELKSRPVRPFSVHIAQPQDAERYVRKVPAEARRLMTKGWPGPVTLLLPTGGELADPKLRRAGLHEVLCRDDLIGLRCPEPPVTRTMLAAVDSPVVAPSANLAGRSSPRDPGEVLDSLDGRIDLLIDAGPTRYGKDSTIVRFDRDGWRIVRAGVYDERAVRGLLQRRILFVCTGNTCRSPIAAGLARKFLAERNGCEVSDLRKCGLEVLSAGLFAAEGGRASPEAVRAARELDADISRHRSRKVTTELINSADVILCMTSRHVAEICRMSPSAAGKTQRLDESADIVDPIGGGVEVYCRIAQNVQRALRNRLKEGLL
jgi:tRNA threonylcarbamoyl adenosine modification protein (Sua5/YciO/YrdC/YwlC family)